MVVGRRWQWAAGVALLVAYGAGAEDVNLMTPDYVTRYGE